MKKVKYISPKDQLILDILDLINDNLMYGEYYGMGVYSKIQELKDIMTEDRIECEVATGTVWIKPKPLEDTAESI